MIMAEPCVKEKEINAMMAFIKKFEPLFPTLDAIAKDRQATDRITKKISKFVKFWSPIVGIILAIFGAIFGAIKIWR